MSGMKLSRKQIIWLVVLLTVFVIALGFLKKESVELAEIEGPGPFSVQE